MSNVDRQTTIRQSTLMSETAISFSIEAPRPHMSTRTCLTSFCLERPPAVKSAVTVAEASESAWSREVCYVLERRHRRLTRSSPFPPLLSREAKYLPGELSAEAEKEKQEGNCYTRCSCFAVSAAAAAAASFSSSSPSPACIPSTIA